MAMLLVVLILFFSKILFTDKIIRAPDIINEFYWWAKYLNDSTFLGLFKDISIQSDWDALTNGGTTTGGGTASLHFLLDQKLILNLFPAPANVAWFIVLHLFWGAAGMYMCCRLIGTSRFGAFFAGLIFALATENASLINAGHVMKIATISYAPWAFFCLEKGCLERRVFWFMATGFVLAFQFFNTHWQIAYYTCLCVGLYGIIRSSGILVTDHDRAESSLPRLLGLNLVVVLFFLATVSISLIPLADWSKDTNRGVQSGANQGKGGLEREEAMSWSLPPEEVVAFVIPGFFGFSRQEAGPNPPNINSYYWGRMVFTQTASYMGLLPWLLLPLPLLFRRDRYSWLAVLAIAGGILFSMGKYTPFYNLLYDYFPGINRFRVPKMIMFIPVMGLGVMAARGIDLLMDPEIRLSRKFRRYQTGIVAFSIGLLLFMWMLQAGRDTWIRLFYEMLSQPTRYEQGDYLLGQRWNSLVFETGIAVVLAALSTCVIVFGMRLRQAWLIAVMLILVYLGDTWRVNDKFMFLVDAPAKSRASKTPAMEFIARDAAQYRTLPMDGSDPMQYVSNKIPVLFTSNPVQQARWQEYLDSLNLNSQMLDIMNVKYLVYNSEQYAQEKELLGTKFKPVFQSPDGQQVVLENRTAMPKAWLVTTVYQAAGRQALSIIQNQMFDPRTMAVVEVPPPIAMTGVAVSNVSPGTVSIQKYESKNIAMTAQVQNNSLLVLGEKYYRSWKAYVDGKETDIYPVNHVLRGVYLTPGTHKVEFRFDPLPFKIGKYLTLGSFAVFAGMLIREWLLRRKAVKKDEE